MPAKEVLRLGEAMFAKKRDLDTLHQEIALNFYPERADFTDKRTQGQEFAEDLFTAVPVLARRELGNLMSASLRPAGQRWLGAHVDDIGLDKGDDERAFLDLISEIQWRAMYEKRANFVRATKSADHDYAAFGNAVIYLDLNSDGNGLLYRNYHLRDNAWSENAEGKIDVNYRKWNATARQLESTFSGTISEEVKKAVTKDPEKEFEVMHAVLPSRIYPFKSARGKEFPFVSLFIEKDSQKVLEQVGTTRFPYIIPRWHVIPGQPYGRSMATAVMLPDGRTMQAVVRTLREAGEKFVDPPMIQIADAIRGDTALYAGGVTTADMEYDERLGDVLRPVVQDRGGMPIGFEIAESLKADIAAGFFLDKIQLPEVQVEMTAFEVRRRLEEMIRSQSPIFEPINEDYNGQIADNTFELLLANGAFPIDEMPETLDGMETNFKFRSPLADMEDQHDAEVFLDVRDRILAPSAQIDPAQLEQVNWDEATRDAMRAAGFKPNWFKPIEAIQQKREENARAAEIQQGIETLGAGGEAAQQVAGAVQAIDQA
jgi:hypothetical protein